MDDTQLDRLRLLESELLHLQRDLARMAARVFDLHETTCEMLNRELAGPLTR